MVDVSPYGGDYRGVVVSNNFITGGFATQAAKRSETNGSDPNGAIIKYVLPLKPQHSQCLF